MIKLCCISTFKMIKLCCDVPQIKNFEQQSCLCICFEGNSKNKFGNECILTHFTMILVHPLNTQISNSCVSKTAASISICMCDITLENDEGIAWYKSRQIYFVRIEPWRVRPTVIAGYLYIFLLFNQVVYRCHCYCYHRFNVILSMLALVGPYGYQPSSLSMHFLSLHLIHQSTRV